MVTAIWCMFDSPDSNFLRDGEKTIEIKFALLRGWALGAERKIVQKMLFFVGKRHDNKILNVRIILSRNFVVIAQAQISQGARGGVWNGGGWNRQISGPEIDFSGPEISSKIPCFAG